jgi:ABC-type nitrate/sulfonate/bicarbonate transport system ATPase subunit
LRTLLYDRDILLLDEPFGALDAQTRLDMQNWLLRIWQDVQKTVLFVTHDIDEALYLSDDVYVFGPRPGSIKACLHGRIHGNEKATRERAQALFGLFGLAGYENAWPSDLSGGMRQRAAFLRTTLCDADILLLDEPFGALDVISRGDMQDWLVSMKQHLGRTCLLVTHDIDEAIFLSDRILVMGGRPAAIRSEYRVDESNRTREWLYAQSELRHRLHDSIRGLETEKC